jgi:hypothetical protein
VSGGKRQWKKVLVGMVAADCNTDAVGAGPPPLRLPGPSGPPGLPDPPEPPGALCIAVCRLLATH